MMLHLLRVLRLQSSSILCLAVVLALLADLKDSCAVAHAQMPPPITSSGLNTLVSSSVPAAQGKIQFNITGGTRAGNGANLFHSFGEFGVPTNSIANFLNETALPTMNILGRVTGGNNSNIFGTIQTTGFGNANLFLMNPAGFLFGPNATVNVGGMVTFTSADYLRLTDGVRFNAAPNAVADALLSAAPVAAFGFLGSNPGAIIVQGSQLTVSDGQGISLVGGNIIMQSGTLDNDTVQPTRLSAPNGQINLASAASPGEILSPNLQLAANVNGESFTSLGSIMIGQDARIDTAGTTAGTIAIRGGQLTIRDGATIASSASSNPAAPAGSVTINGTGIQMTGSDVVINGTNVSVTGSKVTAANLDGSGGTITISAGSVAHPGNVTVAQDAILDASGTRGGSITIRGSQLTIADATLLADTGNTNGAPIAIEIKVTGDLSITDTRGIPAITARTTGTGNAGEIQMTSGNLMATSSFVDPSFLPTTLIDSHTSGDGRGGDVHIITGNFTVRGPDTNSFVVIDSGTTGNGHGGNITIQANLVDLDWTSISTGQFVASAVVPDRSTINGSAGNLIITTETLRTKDSIFDTSALFGTSKLQKGGDITITAGDISMLNTQVTSIGVNGGGAFTVKADRFVTDFTSFETDTTSGQGGNIVVEARVVELTNGSSLISTTIGDGNAGDIHITATDHVSLIGDLGTNPLAQFQPSGLFSNSFGKIFGRFGGQGNAGNIIVTTPRLEMNAGRINTVTSSSGQGGNVTLSVTSGISISGEFPSDLLIVPSIFDIGPLAPSGIVTSTVGSEFCAGPCGNAGNVSISSTGSLSMGSGSQINSGTSSTGNGGLITINASDTISMSGRLSDGSPVGIFSSSIGTSPDAGSGGNIALTAGQSMTISNGASVSASSTGPGNAGNISINTGQQFEMRNSSVKTEAAQASGGNIDIQAIDRVRLVNSSISTSVLGGAGSGGNITIDPNVVVLQNSQVIAQAIQGAGGNITITTPLFLADSTSLVSASSQFGLNGTVTIQSPTSDLSGSLGPLTSKPSQAQSLLTQRCAALANGQASSFVVAGREQLPVDPGGWLASPLALAGIDPQQFGNGTVAYNSPKAIAAHDTDTVSLRRLTPAGFLIANFADSEATGCRS